MDLSYLSKSKPKPNTTLPAHPFYPAQSKSPKHKPLVISQGQTRSTPPKPPLHCSSSSPTTASTKPVVFTTFPPHPQLFTYSYHHLLPPTHQPISPLNASSPFFPPNHITNLFLLLTLQLGHKSIQTCPLHLHKLPQILNCNKAAPRHVEAFWRQNAFKRLRLIQTNPMVNIWWESLRRLPGTLIVIYKEESRSREEESS